MHTKYDDMSKDQLIEMIEEANTALQVKEKQQWAETDANIYVTVTMNGAVNDRGDGYVDEFNDYLKGVARVAEDTVLAYLKSNINRTQNFAEFVDFVEADWEE